MLSAVHSEPAFCLPALVLTPCPPSTRLRPHSRITAAEALQDPWLLEMTSSRGAPPPSPSRRNSMAPGAASNVLPGLPHHHHTVPAKAAHAAV